MGQIAQKGKLYIYDNWNEREGNWQGRMERKYKIKTLGKERCENSDTLCMNKKLN